MATPSPGNPFGGAAVPSATNPFASLTSVASTHPRTPPIEPAASSQLSTEASTPGVVKAGKEPMSEEAVLVALGNSIRTEFLRGLPQRRGILKKLGGFSLGVQAFKSLVDRWVEIRGPVVEYYNSIREAELPDRKPKGVLLLDETSKLIAPVRHEKIPSPYAFIIETRKRSEVFAATSEAEYQAWVMDIGMILKTLEKFMP